MVSMLLGVMQDVVVCRCKEPAISGASKCRKLLRSNVLCIDFLGSHFEDASLKAQLQKHVEGIKVSSYIILCRPHIHRDTIGYEKIVA